MTAVDRQVLRDLAHRVAEMAATPEHQGRPELWYAQNRLKPIRPLVFCSPEGSWPELIPDSDMRCEDADARGIEWGLRMRLYAAEHFHDDQVCDNHFRVGPAVSSTGWGVGPEYVHPEAARGAYVWDPPVKQREDIDRIQTPKSTHDSEATARALAFHQDLFGDILEVYVHGTFWWGLGLIDEWTFLRGIQQTYLDMTDDPELVHAGMRRLMEGRLAWLRELETLGVLSLNNGNSYVGSGGFGFSDQLPADDFSGSVRLKDLWGFCEAQTMSEVSPAMHEEFVLEYQLPILELFGLNCYGCCEPLHRKLDLLLRRVPRLRRVSISPWADKRVSAEALEDRVIFSWKPNPAALAAVEFDPEWVRRDIRETVEICRANGCVLEIIIKDTHTCNHQPKRFDDWTRIAMEEAVRGAE
ncbi:MAG TPA: hypothetical protein PLD23_18590 [Armatimonadota bacterium]|nr:hypothetical protein [Armatimonadota bacterium]